MQKVSLYIPCYNSAKTLKECLEGVLRQSYPIDEILLINDGSTDNTLEIARNYPVRIISHSRNRGIAAARNTAFREARNEFVAAVDSDCVVDQYWLANLMECFKGNDVAGVGGRLIDRHIDSLADKWRLTHMPQNWGKVFINSVSFIYGNNSVYKKSLIISAGLYNEAFKSNYEDIDISSRLKALGYKFIYNPDAIAEHSRKDTLNSVWNRHWHWCRYMHVNSLNINSFSRRIAARIAMVEGNFENILYRDSKDYNYGLIFADLLFIFFFLWLDLRCFLTKLFLGKKNGE